jgi:enamine deaminase RidA (YjgF/YER057c/UK114 family)
MASAGGDASALRAARMIWKRSFGEEPPVRTTVSVAGLPGNSLVEIDVIAYV